MTYLIGKTSRELNAMIKAHTQLVATIVNPEGREIETSIVRVRWHKDEYQCMTRDNEWHAMRAVRES